MKSANILLALFIGVIIATTITACSKDKSPVEPVIDNVPISFGAESENRSVLAVYDAVIDPVNKTFTIEPANRTTEYHYPLTQLYPNVLQITGYGWTPNLWADIKISHPLPGSGIDAFDPRVIAILPANAGVSCSYPIFNVNANDSVILEPDGYTKMYDALSGSIVGNANPFIAYFKEQAYRQWSSINPLEETKRWQMDINGFGGSFEFKFVVDVSTNYPQPPYPYIDNALEPVQMQIEIGEGLTTTGGSATVTATLLDWQGASEIKCKVESPDLFDGTVQLFYREPGPNPHEYVFTGTISNDLHAEPGDYDLLLATWDINVGNHVFKEAKALVDIVFDPVDITPRQLNFSPKDVWIEGNYAYTASGENGVHIFDISDPSNPEWVSMVDIPLSSNGIHVIGDYAFVAHTNTLQIIDINPPESAYIVKSVETTCCNNKIHVAEGYAYLTSSQGMVIVDIDPIDTASQVNAVTTSGYAVNICTSGDYAFITNSYSYSGLDIIDISIPESAFIVKSVETISRANGVQVKDGYAYVSISGTGSSAGLAVVDIDPVENAEIKAMLEITTGYTIFHDVAIHDNIAYLPSCTSGLYFIDISDPEAPERINWLSIKGCINQINYKDGLIYAANSTFGLQVIDVEPLEDAFLLGCCNTPGWATKVCISDGYAYLYSGELQIIDVDPVEDAEIVNRLENNIEVVTVVLDNYAYVPQRSNGLTIYNVTDPESMFPIITIDTPISASGIFVADDYAYVWNDWNDDFLIIDIDPPETAHVIKLVNHYSSINDLVVKDGYAYIATCDNVIIYDVDPPDEAHYIKYVGGYGAYEIDNEGDYVFATTNAGIFVFDISDPVNTEKVKTITTQYTPLRIFVTDGYAYVKQQNRDDLVIIDIEPLEDASVVYIYEDLDCLMDVYVNNSIAYIAGGNTGLRIIDLW